MTLISLIREYVSLLNEYAPTGQVTLYHRSSKDFVVGDVLTPQTDEKTGKHWLQEKYVEQELERIRERDYPELPSRFNCVYATLVPRSRFNYKGKLYVIEPAPDSHVHVTDSRLIDDAVENSHTGPGRAYQLYWHEAKVTKANLPFIEVLLDNATVTEVIDEGSKPSRGQIGFKFRLKAPLDIDVSVYAPTSGENAGTLRIYKDTHNEVTLDEYESIIAGLKGVSIVKRDLEEWSKKITVRLPAGWRGKVTRRRERGNYESSDERLRLPITMYLTPQDVDEPMFMLSRESEIMRATTLMIPDA